MRLFNILFVIAAFTGGAWAADTFNKPVSMIKTIPEVASLEYRIRGQIIQTMTIMPGTYEISIKQLH
jgi:hypothetical protein